MKYSAHKCCDEAEWYLWFGTPNLSYRTDPSWWIMVEGNAIEITHCPWCGVALAKGRNRGATDEL